MFYMVLRHDGFMLVLSHFGAAPNPVYASTSGVVVSSDPTVTTELANLQRAINAAASELKMGELISKLDGRIGRETVLSAIAVVKAALSSLDPTQIAAPAIFGALAKASPNDLATPDQLKTWTVAVASARIALAQTFQQVAGLAHTMYAAASAVSPAGTKSRTGLYIGIAAAVLAVGTVATVAIVSSRRRAAAATS